MVVLSMHIVRHTSAERGETSARCNRRCKTQRQERRKQLTERDPRLGDEHAGLGVECEQSIQAGGDYRAATTVQGHVTVTSACTKGQQAAVGRKRRR